MAVPGVLSAAVPGAGPGVVGLSVAAPGDVNRVALIGAGRR
ncbi:hypothetical protein [Actinoplanes sp. N902-109]|nr:hypothetical protein [Actinoplanes sp. N902-109]AGL14663.1 hypothetical protein L083_1153 [Actinoplanes sp. N902-109]